MSRRTRPDSGTAADREDTPPTASRRSMPARTATLRPPATGSPGLSAPACPRRLVPRPRQHRFYQPRRVGAAFRHWPPVVAAPLDQIDFVQPVRAVLRDPQPPGRIPRQPLDIAVAERPHRRGGIGVVGRDGAVGIDAKYLAAQRRPVLRPPSIAGFARHHVAV